MTQPTAPGVAIILVNYRGADDTIACLDSLKNLGTDNVRVIVVDNDSADDSISRIKASHSQVEVIASEQNLGFSGGNNLGIQRALEDPQCQYIWLLNNDTTIEPNSLQHLLNTAEKRPNHLIGSLILYPDGRFQGVGTWLSRFRCKPRYYTIEQVTEGQTVESLSGCSMLIPRQILEAIGLLDEAYFLYFEDNEFCLRAHQKGFDCIVEPKSRVYHQKNAATGKNPPLITYYYQRNRLRLARQYFKPFQFLCLQIYTVYRLLHRQLQTIGKSSCSDKAIHFRALKLGIQDFYRGITGQCPHTF